MSKKTDERKKVEETIVRHLKSYFQGQKKGEKIGPLTKLKDDLSFDSLDYIDLAMELEEEFDVVIEDAEMLECLDARHCAELMLKKLSPETKESP